MTETVPEGYYALIGNYYVGKKLDFCFDLKSF